MRIWPQLEFQLQVGNWAEAEEAIQRELHDFFGGHVPENLVVYASAEAEHYETAQGPVLAHWDIHVQTEGGKYDVDAKNGRRLAQAVKEGLQDLERESR